VDLGDGEIEGHLVRRNWLAALKGREWARLRVVEVRHSKVGGREKGLQIGGQKGLGGK